MATPKRTIRADFFLLAAITSKNTREPIYDFTATIGEIITDMPYLYESGIARAKRTIPLFSPSFEDKPRLKTLNLQFSTKKQVNF